MAEIALNGLRPDILAGYLGALGIFRAVARQLDDGATLRWDADASDRPILSSEVLGDGQALLDWVGSSYHPSPIASPWNSGAGFFGSSRAVPCQDGSKRDGVHLVLATTDPRLETYRAALEAMEQARLAAEYEGQPDRKVDLLRQLRRTLPDPALPWLDAAAIVEDRQSRFPSLLGSGGNDGRLDLGNNFMIRLCSLLPLHGNIIKRAKDAGAWSRALLGACLLDTPADGLEEDSAGQFAPASRAAPNGSSGSSSFVAKKQSNPWAFVWALEGCLWFGGSATRRLSSHARARLAVPFQAEPIDAGYGSAALRERKRDELWLPLWTVAARRRELTALFGEARAQVGRRRARTGLDYARAAASLGSLRGLDAFRRFSVLERAGQSNIAVCLGRFPITQSKRIDLLRGLDAWIEGYQRLAANKYAPPRFASAARSLEERVFELARRDDERQLLNVLAALGNMQRELAKRPDLVHGETALHRLRPLELRGSGWLTQLSGSIPEVRLALAFSWLEDRTPFSPPRQYVSADWGRPDATAPSAASGPRLGLAALLAEVLRRRLLQWEQRPATEAEVQAGRLRHPTGGRTSVAQISDLEVLQTGELDEPLTLDLLWAFSHARPEALRRQELPAPDTSGASARVPGAWFALLRTALSPLPLVRGDDAPRLPRPDPALVEALLAGQPQLALQVAARRLRGAGLRPRPGVAEQGPAWNHATCERVAGALLLPLPPAELGKLVRRALAPHDDAERGPIYATYYRPTQIQESP